jgi:hypothetical protein
MTEDEKKRLLAGFVKAEQPEQEEEPDEDPQREEKLLAVAKRIIERLNLEGKLQ